MQGQALLLYPGHVVLAPDVELRHLVLRVLVEDDGQRAGPEAATLELLIGTLRQKNESTLN